MRIRFSVIVAVGAMLSLALAVGARAAITIDDLNRVMDSVRLAEADVFAPRSFDKARSKADEARQAVRQGKKQKEIESLIAAAMEFAENSLKTTEVSRLSLAEYLAPRQKARAANAPILVPELYIKAEQQFTRGTEKVEGGDVKGGIREAEKASPLFDAAEAAAIRKDILGNADQLLAAAVTDGAEQFAAATLEKARAARAKADAILSQDRYRRDEASAEARRAAYEARHASNIAQSVRSLNRNDQAWEKLMLVYEIQMNRVGEDIGLGQVPFDNGPLAAADSLTAYVKAIQKENLELTATRDSVISQLGTTLGRLSAAGEDDDPLRLAAAVDAQVAAMQGDVSRLAGEIEAEKSKVSQLAGAHEEVTAELQTRKDKEEKFRKAKDLIMPSEGEVLFNSSNDIVLRLSGLSFDVGKSDLKDEHIPLLEKVKEIVSQFPDAELMIEGHTDASGDAAGNTALSEKRALAVMQYLRQSLLIPADRIKAVGYGSEKPVAGNQTAEGRAKNRRIDVVIMQ